MSGARSSPPSRWTALAALAVAATAATAFNLCRSFPVSAWRNLWSGAPTADVTSAMLWYGALPRVAIALIAGAALGLSGALFQKTLRNPLAEPTTLGVSAGAYAALALASVVAPDLMGWTRGGVATAGAVASLALVAGVAWTSALSPLPLLLAGLTINLVAGSIAAVVSVLERSSFESIALWGAGALEQNGWSTTLCLACCLIVGGAACAALIRPLSTLALDDESATSLGLPLRGLRFAALIVATGLAAGVTASVGVLAFVGLAGPRLAILCGARRFGAIALGGAAAGAALLLLADQAAAGLGRWTFMPAGIATAVLGAPLMLGMLRSVRESAPGLGVRMGPSVAASRASVAPALVVVGLAAVVALMFGRGQSGWAFGDGTLANAIAWRWPRVVAAFSAGAALGAAGVLTQRLTDNPMASPETLGVSSGAGAAVVVLALLTNATSAAAQVLAAAAGAAATLAAGLLLGRRQSYSPERLLLVGAALGTFLGAAATAVLTIPDPRFETVLTWMSGSTYLVSPQGAIATAATTALALATAPLVIRGLIILPLGVGFGRSVGLGPASGQASVATLASVLTAVATLVVGPVSFVGLMAPHVARMTGCRKPGEQIFAAGAIGAAIMLAADWIGRNLMFPYEIPAGLIASLLGGPYVLYQLRTMRR